MKNVRIYGGKPYTVAVVHGGPGAPGSMAPVARELAKNAGVLEPLQTKDSVNGQVEELCNVLKENDNLPVTLIGHSWGAMLAYIFTSRYPSFVKKLLLIGSGPFEQQYADNITPDRLNRLSEAERVEVLNLTEIVNDTVAGDKDKAMTRIGELFAKADTYDALPPGKDPEPLPVSEEVNRKVWMQAKEFRISGELLVMGRKIHCPVVAVHGDYDPHLPEGVKEPLSHVIKDFRFILLEKCGHYPWMERFARDKFYDILKKEIV